MQNLVNAETGELKRTISVGKIICLFLVWQIVLPIISQLMLLFFDGLADTSYAKSDLVFFFISDLLAVLILFRSYKKFAAPVAFDKKGIVFFPIGIVLAFCSGDCVARALSLLPNYEALLASYEELMGSFEGNVILQVLVLAIVGPIGEEIFFRGIVYERLKGKYSVWPSIIISSVIFGVVHLVPLQMIDATIGGIIMCIAYEKYHNLIFPIFIHIINNLLAVLGPEFASEAPFWVQILIITVEIVVTGIILFKFFVPLEDKREIIEHEEQDCCC